MEGSGAGPEGWVGLCCASKTVFTRGDPSRGEAAVRQELCKEVRWVEPHSACQGHLSVVQAHGSPTGSHLHHPLSATPE